MHDQYSLTLHFLISLIILKSGLQEETNDAIRHYDALMVQCIYTYACCVYLQEDGIRAISRSNRETEMILYQTELVHLARIYTGGSYDAGNSFCQNITKYFLDL